MLTLKHLERLWTAQDYPRLARELLAGRPECSPGVLLDSANRTACAALALIRLDEFARPFHPVSRPLLHALLSAQRPDGGWGEGTADPATTALVLRALARSAGGGLAFDRGLAFLAGAQRPDGGFARIPLQRLPTDPLTTALVLHHLSFIPRDTPGVDLDAAAGSLADVPASVLGPLARRRGPTARSAPTLSHRLPASSPRAAQRCFAFTHPN